MADDKKEDTPAAAPAPIFGSAAFGVGGFGANTGFGAATFGAASTFGSAEKKKADAEDDGAEGEGESADPEAECTATFKPLVQLEEVQVQSGEEDEDAVFEAKTKAYCFSDDTKEWKEKGVGPVKFLKHKETKKIRLLMRRDKTLKICANFLVLPGVKLAEHAGSDKSVVFTCMDFSAESSGKQEKFCLRFGTIEKVEQFRKEFVAAQQNNKDLGVGAVEGGEGGEASGEVSHKSSKDDGKVEDGEEVTSKAADALASQMGGVKV